MAFRISGASVRNPTPALVLFAVLSVLGLVAFRMIPITNAPSVDIPIVSITVTEPGAAPAELEAQVTKKIEDSVAAVTGVKHVTSTVTDGVSVTAVELRLEIGTDRALNDVKDAVARVRADLPRSIDEPVIERVDVVGQSILTYAATAPGRTIEGLSWFVDDTTLRALQGVAGVGQVKRIGGVSREIRVSLDPAMLAGLGLTAADVNAQLHATSVDLAGGRGDLGGKQQTIRTLGGATTVQTLAETRIVLPGGRVAMLSDLGVVTDLFEEPVQFARIDGIRPVVAFSIFRAKGASEVNVADRVSAKLAELSAAHPDVAYQLIDDSVAVSRGGYLSAMHALIEGAVLAVIVVMIFLRDWRATLLAAIAIPLSIIPAFAAMQAMGFSLNFISLLAITLVTGILVDDAIVEIENIVRHIRMGKTPWNAAIEAADEIGMAVVAITLTIVAVFAPVSFMGGIPGQYFKQFGLTVAAAVLVSLLVARLITPLAAAHLLRPHRAAAAQMRDGAIMRLYLRVLRLTIAAPKRTMLLGLMLFALSLWSTTLLPTGFLPAQDRSRIVLWLELPPGATLDDTARKTDEAAIVARGMAEVASVFVIGGTTPTGQGAEIRKATMMVNLVPRGERARSQKQVEAELSQRLARVADLRGWYVNERGERELAVTVSGDDPAALEQGVAGIEGAMRRLPGFSNVAANAGVLRPELRILPRGPEAARFGITTEAISQAVRVATIGDVSANLAKLRVGDRLIPIRVQMASRLRRDRAGIGALTVSNAAGLAVPIAAVADIVEGAGPSSIERYDRRRRVVLGADLASTLALGQALAEVYATPAATHLPPGVYLVPGGDAEIMGEVFSGFALAMGAGLMLVLAVLVLLFGGVFQPLVILLSLPLCLGGVIAALVVTGDPISLPVVIGILMLLGIVTKNAIMLVDFALGERARGTDRVTAILEAGRKRARPIVMTTVAMVAGMVPSALGIGDGGEFRAPMAVAVIGGLIVSTALSLLFVPAFHIAMDDLSNLTRRLARGGRTAKIPAFLILGGAAPAGDD